jgi:hypothetical protein
MQLTQSSAPMPRASAEAQNPRLGDLTEGAWGYYRCVSNAQVGPETLERLESS